MNTFVPGDKVKVKGKRMGVLIVKDFIEDDDGALTGYRLIDKNGMWRFFRHEDLTPAFPKKKKRRKRKS